MLLVLVLVRLMLLARAVGIMVPRSTRHRQWTAPSEGVRLVMVLRSRTQIRCPLLREQLLLLLKMMMR